MSIELALIALCAASCAACIAAVYLEQPSLRALSKSVASACFVILAFTRAELAEPYDVAVIVALVLGAAGDLALLGRSRAAVRAGLVVFAAGHLAYLVAFSTVSDASAWLSVPALIALLACIAAGAYLGKHAGSLRGAVWAYALIMAAVVAGGYAAAESRGAIVFLAALLFAISDLAVARQRFVTSSPHNRLVGLPLYYAAQLCLAWNL